RQLRAALDQRVVQVEPGQLWHAHVEHQARGLAGRTLRQRVDGRQRVAEGAHVEAGAAQPEARRLEELDVVVDDVDGACGHDALDKVVEEEVLISGRPTWKVAPRSALRVNQSRPWCSSTNERQIDRPMPMPLGLLDANGTNSLAAASSP